MLKGPLKRATSCLSLRKTESLQGFEQVYLGSGMQAGGRSEESPKEKKW